MKKQSKTKKRGFNTRHPLLIPVSSFLVLFFFGLIGIVAMGGTTQGPADAKIVNIYVDREQRTVTTRASTVGDLIQRLDLSLNEKDIVEPSRDSVILEDDTQVNIYRARPVQIVDGRRVITVMTAQQSPRLIANDAGIDFVTEDDLRLEKSNSDIIETSVAEQVIIERSIPVQLNVYGAIKQLRSTANTVEELLEEQGVTVNEGETVEPSKDTPLTSEMLISVNLPGIKTVAVEEDIPFAVEQIDDDTIPVGESAVDQQGVLGRRAVIYEVQEENGVEVSRKEIQVLQLREPVAEIRRRGTKITVPYFDPNTNVSADKIALMSAAGISPEDYAYVDFIVSKESNWRPGALNSSSGAYGLCQSLPASKMASAGADYLTNPVTQLRWCSGYSSRYGGWAGAYSAWLVQGWW